ncbi:MAG: methyl-accepting chemotaxis protein [Planctomycetes bacterium]|nr:methyl-accepting chemotaxis protein [Planctomycetota bacterium]
MSSSTTPLRQRLVFRITYLGILPAVLILGLVAGFGIYKAYTDSEEMTRNNLRQVAERVAAELDVQNRMACVLVSTMATQKAARWNPVVGDREQTLKAMKSLVLENPWSIGVYFDYEVNADGLDSHYAAHPMDGCQAAKSGQFVPYAFLDWRRGNALSVKPTVDMETSLFFAGIREIWRSSGKTQPLITEPYVYDGQAMIETVAPIIVDGKFVGIAGCDRALRDIAKAVREVCEANGVDAFVISQGSTVKGLEKPRAFVTASTDPKDAAEDAVEGMLRTRAVDGTPFAALFSNFMSVASEEVQNFDAEDPTKQVACMWARKSLQLPDGNRWDVIVREFRSDALAAANERLLYQGSAAALGVCVLAALLIIPTRSIGNRVGTATESAKRMAVGDLSAGAPLVTGSDEAAHLLAALGAMHAGMESLITKVKQATININSTATELTATARQQERGAHGLSASTTQVAAAARQIAATSGELGKAMERVAASAARAAELAQSGRSSLDGMGATMHRLDESTAGIAARLSAISEKAATINSVVVTITKVADQTNLLSVNAAIEAEKAGEHGVGFLVVAREIRRLADQTAAATLDIEQTVRQMQGAVSTGVMEMDRFAEQVRRGVADVDTIGSQLGQIIEQVDEGSSQFAEVNAGMRNQSEGARQISEAMGGLTGTARETLLAAEESSRAAERLLEAMGELKTALEAFKLRK